MQVLTLIKMVLQQVAGRQELWTLLGMYGVVLEMEWLNLSAKGGLVLRVNLAVGWAISLATNLVTQNIPPKDKGQRMHEYLHYGTPSGLVLGRQQEELLGEFLEQLSADILETNILTT